MNRKKQFAISFLGSLILTLGMRSFDFIYSQKDHKADSETVCQKAAMSLEAGDSNATFVLMNQELLKTYTLDQFCVSIQNGNNLLTQACTQRTNREYKCKLQTSSSASIFFVERSFFEFNFIKIFSIFFIILEVLLFICLRLKSSDRK